ncbi:MAG: DUF4238 domain-containing protein [Patescibacteria group bacterium]
MLKSHFVSKVVLKQFCGKTGKLSVFKKQGGVPLLKSQSEFAFVRLPSDVFSNSEDRWNRTERRYTACIDLINNGGFFTHKKCGICAEVIKVIMSIHYVRSLAFYSLLSTKEKEKYDELVEEFEKIISDKATFRKKWIIDLMVTLPDIIQTNINKVLDEIEKYSLEIIKAPKYKYFIIGDVPVVTWNKDGHVGFLDGVGLNNSDIILMPISPKYAVSLTSHKGGYISVSVKWLRWINKQIRKICRYEFYALPK